jgi:hypothetical protein
MEDFEILSFQIAPPGYCAVYSEDEKPVIAIGLVKYKDGTTVLLSFVPYSDPLQEIVSAGSIDGFVGIYGPGQTAKSARGG